MKSLASTAPGVCVRNLREAWMSIFVWNFPHLVVTSVLKRSTCWKLVSPNRLHRLKAFLCWNSVFGQTGRAKLLWSFAPTRRKCHALSLQGSLKSEPSLFRSIFETISERKHLAGWFEESLQRLRSFPEVMRPCFIQGAMATDSEVSSRSLPGLGEELKVYNGCSTLFLLCRTNDISRVKTGYCLSPWCKMGQVALLRQSKPSERKWLQVLVQTCYCGVRFLTSTAFQWAELDGQQLVCRVVLAPTAGSKSAELSASTDCS